MIPRGDDLRLHELLAGRALGDLSPAESRELRARLAVHPDAAGLEREAAGYEQIAASLRAATPARGETLPGSLAARLSSLARDFEAGRLQQP